MDLPKNQLFINTSSSNLPDFFQRPGPRGAISARNSSKIKCHSPGMYHNFRPVMSQQPVERYVCRKNHDCYIENTVFWLNHQCHNPNRQVWLEWDSVIYVFNPPLSPWCSQFISTSEWTKKNIERKGMCSIPWHISLTISGYIAFPPISVFSLLV